MGLNGNKGNMQHLVQPSDSCNSRNQHTRSFHSIEYHKLEWTQEDQSNPWLHSGSFKNQTVYLRELSKRFLDSGKLADATTSLGAYSNAQPHPLSASLLLQKKKNLFLISNLNFPTQLHIAPGLQGSLYVAQDSMSSPQGHESQRQQGQQLGQSPAPTALSLFGHEPYNAGSTCQPISLPSFSQDLSSGRCLPNALGPWLPFFWLDDGIGWVVRPCTYRCWRCFQCPISGLQRDAGTHCRKVYHRHLILNFIYIH